MDITRLEKQIAFIVKIDELKQILRRTLLMDASRRENDAEHSWHFAVMAMLLEEYSAKPINITHVLEMALVHDIVEVLAGDTYAYDAAGYEDKLKREQEAADKLFGMLPEDQGAWIRSLWEEFDAEETDDALYATAMDRLQPLLHNYYTKGLTWKEGHVTSDKVYKRMQPISKAAPELGKFADFIIKDSVEKGYLKK